MLMTAIMLCTVGINCLADANAKQNIISEKKVLQTKTTNISRAKEEPYYVYANSVGSLGVDFKSNGSKITAIKSNDKNLRVKLTHQCDSDFEVEYCARKAGIYKITVTIKTKSGEIINKNIELLAETYPIKKAVYANRKIATSGVHYTQKMKGNLSIKMKKGYKIKKIQLGIRKQGEKIIYKKIKNNQEISLGSLYKLYAGSAVVKISYRVSDSKKMQYLYIHIYKI